VSFIPFKTLCSADHRQRRAPDRPDRNQSHDDPHDESLLEAELESFLRNATQDERAEHQQYDDMELRESGLMQFPVMRDA